MVIYFENNTRNPIEIVVNSYLQNRDCSSNIAIVPVKLFFDGGEKLNFNISSESEKEFVVSDIIVTEAGCPSAVFQLDGNKCVCKPGLYSESQYNGSCLNCSWNCNECTDSLTCTKIKQAPYPKDKG